MIAQCGVALPWIQLFARSLAMTVLVSITNMDLLLAFVLIPESSLVLVIEVHHVEGMLEINEEIARILRCVIFCSCKIDTSVFVLVSLINFLFKLLLVVLDRQILYTEICTEIFAPLDLFNVAWIFVLWVWVAERTSSTTLVWFRCGLWSSLRSLQMIAYLEGISRFNVW